MAEIVIKAIQDDSLDTYLYSAFDSIEDAKAFCEDTFFGADLWIYQQETEDTERVELSHKPACGKWIDKPKNIKRCFK